MKIREMEMLSESGCKADPFRALVEFMCEKTVTKLNLKIPACF